LRTQMTRQQVGLIFCHIPSSEEPEIRMLRKSLRSLTALSSYDSWAEPSAVKDDGFLAMRRVN
ncbi:MAG TPA: hypothetical protein VEI95_09845, partial [Acidobacteriota bacterium]|nr:hypothetical protein [Acidobacteriota bacterium]